MKVEVNFTSNKSEFVKALSEQIEKALTKLALQGQKYARENCPVGDGTLRNSIGFEVDMDNQEAIIGSNLEYAPYVEFGTGIYAAKGDGRKTPWSYEDAAGEWHKTRGMKPQPYLMPAIEEHTTEYKEIVEDTLKK